MSSINTVPEVTIDERDGYKFIVARVTDGQGGEKLVVRAQQNCNYHRDILQLLHRDLMCSGLGARCIGGGRIAINPEEKTIKIWDYSGDFGEEPDRNETVRMLQVAFPEFEVTSGR